MMPLSSLKRLGVSYSGELCYTASRYLNPFINLVTSSIAAAFILPADLGALQSMILIAPYMGFLQLGVFNGLNRNIAFYQAQEQYDAVQQMVDTSCSVAWVIAGIGAVVGGAILLYAAFWARMDGAFIWGAFTLLALLVFSPPAAHFDTTYRSGRHFKKLGIIGFAEDVINGVVGLLPVILGYVGKAMADITKAGLRFLLRWKHQPIRGSFRFSFQQYRALLLVGAPLMVSNYLVALLMVADQSLIAIRLGSEALGHYTLSRLLLIAIQVVPASMAILLYPRASGLYGRVRNNRAMRPFFWKALLFNLVALLPLCGLVYFLIEPLTHWLLPNYVPGIAAAKINILTCLTFVSQGPSIIVGVVKRNAPLLLAMAFSLAGLWIFGLWAMPQITIEAFAWLRFSVSAGLGLFMLGYSYWLTALDEYNE
jgi:O-antigen/teichoic acid export membrane protein